MKITCPSEATATAYGFASVAWVAGIPSPLYPKLPVPAIVVITPDPESTRRTRWPLSSAMYRLPLASMSTSKGLVSCAPMASELSPQPEPAAQEVPSPATVVIVPVIELTTRTRWFALSAMYSWNSEPATLTGTTASPRGSTSPSLACPPSPTPPPTSGATRPLGRIARTRSSRLGGGFTY